MAKVASESAVMQSWTTEALVLKRVSVGEADRVITLLTPHEGKVVAIAKGVRKMSSSQRAYLEPGNLINTHLRVTSSLPIIQQTALLNQFSIARTRLQKMKQFFEVLELADLLFVEDQEDEHGFDLLLAALQLLDNENTPFLQVQGILDELLVHLGYQSLVDTQYTSILQYAETVAERPLRSYAFLSIQHKDMVK